MKQEIKHPITFARCSIEHAGFTINSLQKLTTFVIFWVKFRFFVLESKQTFCHLV